MASARLKELYNEKIKFDLKEKLNLSNIMKVPKITKIVLNVGVKEAVADSKALQHVLQVISNVSGQLPVKCLARKSIATFKIRTGMPIGVKVTLRNDRMYEFLDRLINLALPKVRDFQGVPVKFDKSGNYNLGIRDWVMFPEADLVAQEKSHGLNITICTTADEDEHAYELLKSFGMPFRKK
ncbi:50S ribosomal protein L5 [Candidatus Dependentiae bacterium]|nr:50S ribosomal protein L5 [Candidatus Dependentiae bacterium]